MPYLAEDDYTISISVNHLTQVLTQAATSSGLTADQVRTNSEETAEAEISAYLSGLYEIADEFDETGTDRNRLIIRCYVNLSLYNIFHTISPRDIPEMRQRLYTECIEMLKAYRDGDLNFGLTVVDSDGDGTPDEQTGSIVIQSAKKFISKPFTDPSITTS